MAEIVLGIGTSHSPMLGQSAAQWPEQAKYDLKNKELAFAPSGNVLSFEQALERADPIHATLATQDRFNVQHAATQAAIGRLIETFAEVDPDTVVVISDDQDELFFEDNMPTFSVYWGDSIQIFKRHARLGSNPNAQFFGWGYDQDFEQPVRSELGRHLIEHMIQADFDVAHFNYLNDNYGGQDDHR